MDPALLLTTASSSLGLAVLLGNRRNPLPVAPTWVAALVVSLGLYAVLVDLEVGYLAGACAAVGLLGPALVLARVRHHAARGDYARAAGLLSHLARVHRHPALRRWVEVWRATAALVVGAPAEVDRLIAHWEHLPEASAPREWLLGMRWRWPAALTATATDLRIRAACEQGDVEGAIALCSTLLSARRSLPTGRRRLEWLAPIAFAGHLPATEALCRLLRVPPALTDIWRAAALAAGGHEADARAMLTAVAARPDLTPGLRYVLAQRTANLPVPAALSPAAQDVLQRVEREILAGSLLRLRLPLRAPRTLGLIIGTTAVFVLQTARGGSTDAATAIELGALLPNGGFPDEPMRLLTYAFLHHGALHLCVNLFTVGLVGATVEAAIGGWRFVTLYLGSAVGAGLAISYYGAEEITLGASGAAMGLLAALGVIAARDRRTRGTRTGRVIGLAIAGLVVVQSTLDAFMPEISFAGHLSGALVGAGLGFLLVRGRGSVLHGE
ncbi:rhomboid family intramembrane serine protease [Myxococcota bacterium]|nr:rhomboid family intramembrane serine protease [Myxococcota bacterium]